MTAPDRIWISCPVYSAIDGVMIPGTYTGNADWCFRFEYARVTPDTITLPRAEVEALMGIADEIATVFFGVEFEHLRKHLATLQERMK